MNALFALNKPIGVSSNRFLMQLKRQYKWKKCGYSGTLDPFASGLLIVGVGAYTRLLPYLDKRIKTYEATLWLGARSKTLDIEGIDDIEKVGEYSLEEIKEVFKSLQGKIIYDPPKFSAKHIGGKRAYELAREGIEFTLKKSQMEVFDLKVLVYCHPFLSFRVNVSEGGYIRSLGEMIASKLGCKGSLSRLKRIKEGEIELPRYIQKIEALEMLGLKRLDLRDHQEAFYLGKKMKLPIQDPAGRYLIVFENFFSIIDLCENQEVIYRLNRMPRC